jgi:asparagine synthase (glutamine-hydrolysing)
MFGIAGVIGTPPGATESAVRRMMRAMVHRGPDDEGYEEFPASRTGTVVGFVFRRLAILDLSTAGHKPMIHPGTGDCLVFSG